MFKDLINLFFPPVCEACKSLLDDNEIVICTTCRHDLPVTEFHYNNDEAIKKMLYGRVKLEQATALLHFSKKGLVQELLHNLKYRGHQQVGLVLGEWLGAELATIEGYNTIDMIIPVPLHKRKLTQRGYNQVSKFGKAIAKALQVQYNENILLKIKDEKTQVFKDRMTRFEDMQTRFALSSTSGLENKHILLVDDIITTGATLEACASLFSTINGIKISVATMAVAD